MLEKQYDMDTVSTHNINFNIQICYVIILETLASRFYNESSDLIENAFFYNLCW